MSLNRKQWLVNTLAFVLVCVGFLLISGSASADAYDHKMTFTPSTQSGDPEEQLQYTITIENTGDNDDTYDMSVTNSTIPTGYTAFIIPTELSVEEDETGTATLFVKIANRTTNTAEGGDTAQISFKSKSQNADSGGKTKTQTASLTVNNVYGTTLVPSTGEKTVDPNENVKFMVSVQNTGGNTEDSVTISFSANGVDQWDITPQPSTLTLDIDETAYFNLSVTPDIEAVAGLKSISIISTSEDGETVSSTSVTVKVNQLPALQVDKVGSSSKDVEAGKRVYYSFDVTNKGNAVDTFNLAVDTSSLPDGWDASLDQDKISNLGVDENITLTDVLVVKAPDDAAADVETSIIVTISSDYNASINSTYTSRTTVLQNYEPKLAIVGSDTMSAKPEEQVNFTIKITNDGNGEDDISLSLIGGNSSWGQLGDSAFTLQAGTNDTTTLRVTPPKDTEAKNGYILIVRATSEDGSTTNSRNTFINVEQIFEVSVQVSGDSSKKGDPGDELTYSIVVKNKGNGDDTISLTLEGEKADWGSIVDEVELESGDTTTINLTVNIDDDAVVGDNDIIVRGTSEDNPSANDTGTVKVSVNKQFKIDVVVSSKSGDPGTTITYPVRFQNEGTGVDTFSVTIDDYPSGWSVDPVSFQVEDVPAGGEETVNLSVTIPSGEDNKAFTINLTASSDEAKSETPPKYVNTTVSIITIVNQEYWIEFAASDTAFDATVGIPVSVDFDVINKGSGDDVVSLSVEAPDGWSSVTFNTNYVSVAEDEDKTDDEDSFETATLSITVPEDTEDKPYDVVVTGVSDCATCANGTKSVATLTFSVDVQLSRGVEITADVTEVEKIPGETASYTFTVKNTGDGSDTIVLTVLDDNLDWATLSNESVSLPKEGTALVTVSVSLPEYDLENLTSQQRTALQATDYDIRVKATSESKPSESALESFTTEIGQTFGAKIEVIGDERITSYPSTETDAQERTEKFTFKLINTGNKQDTIDENIITTTYPDEWTVGLFQSSTCSSSFTGSIGAGQSKYLYLCATPDQDSDVGNYTILTEFSPNSGTEPAETVSVVLEVASPRRELSATAIDLIQEINPEYDGSVSQNSVKFKVKLDNTGSNIDKFIPEIESTLEDDWAVTFWQDSSKTQTWPASGVDIEDGELDDLWVFVEVNDEADEGNETIEISIRNEEDDPKARAEITLTVVVQRPEITISAQNIQLEIEGEIGNASSVKEEDTVVIVVDVENIGNADADDVRVEIFYYPKKSPTTQEEIDDLLISGFVFDEDKNTYIYVLYDKETSIKVENKKSTVYSDDWIIKGGEWYVEVRADYDEDDSNGKILEPNENNNDARYSDILRVKPDLSIDSMRVDSKYAGSQTPNIDQTVTFTVSISNSGAADVSDARLYITADTDAESSVRLKERSNKEYVTFDIDSGESSEVKFRWKAEGEIWTSFKAEINPVCDDYSIDSFTCLGEGDGFAAETDRMFDELGRYANNEYPRTGVFEQSGAEVVFEILPDFRIKKVSMDPKNPEVGEDVTITVTIENKGNADWPVFGAGQVIVIFEDGVGAAQNEAVGDSINKDDTAEVEFTWKVPDEDKEFLTLTFTIDAKNTDQSDMLQCDTCDPSVTDGKDNDEYTEEFTLVLSAVLGEIEFINTLTERELVRGVPLWMPVVGLGALIALAVPVAVLRRRGGGKKKSKKSDDDEVAEEEVEEEQEAAPPSKIGVAIVSTLDGKTANVKVPSNMPVNKLLQNCVGKFPLPHANFAVMLNGVAVDINATLEGAGLTDGCQVDLVPLE